MIIKSSAALLLSLVVSAAVVVASGADDHGADLTLVHAEISVTDVVAR